MAENTLIVRFRAYRPDGASIGILPHPLSWEAGIPLNDMPSLTMTYPDGSEAAELLKNPCEIALELRNPSTGAFVEHPGCRFINIRRSVDLAVRPRILSFTMPSYGWMLKKVRWMDPDNPRLNKEGQIVYTNLGITAATPLVHMINYAHARGNVPGLTIPFTPIFDADGNNWPDNVKNVSFDYGQDAWSVLDSFSRQGYFDWRMNKRALELFRTGITLRRMLDTDTGVHIHSMLATTEEPVERTWEEVAGTVVAIGDNGLTAGMVVLPDSPTDFPWGKWDEAITASGVSDVQMLATITDNLLATKYKSRTQYTKKFIWTEGAPVPLVDYQPGDFIRAMSDAASGAQKASMRVYQITLSGQDPYGVSVALTLNDRFTDRSLQMDRWVSRVSGAGGPVGGGGTGAGGGRPQQPINNAKPAKPTVTVVTNEGYFSTLGEPVAMADVAFTTVTKDIYGKEIDIARYNVAARRSDFNWQQARTVIVAQPDSPSTGQVIHGKVPLLDSGYSYEFRVQAIRTSGYPSEWSNSVTQTMGYPTEALTAPSVPLLSTKLSTVKAEWDGKDSTGAAYPAQFREIQVEVSRDQANWFHAGDIFSPGSSLIMSGKGGTPTWNVGDTVYVRFKVMNSAAVISGISGVSSIVVQGVTGPDIAANSITANNIAAGTLTAEQIKAHSVSVESLSIGDPRNLIVDPTFSSATLNTARLAQAAISSPVGVVWTVTANGTVKLTNNVTASSFSRFGFSNNTLLNVALATFPGPPLSSPELVIPVTRPGNTNGTSTGSYKARYVVTVTGIPAGGLGAASITLAVLARQFQRSGLALTTAGTVVANYNITANGTFTVESVTGFNVPAGTVGLLPYLYAALENGVPAGVALEFSQVEFWQESSVFIGNGLITTPLLSANAVTTDVLNADAITAKHAIRSAYYEMNSQSGGTTIKITENANYNGQAGIRFDGLTPEAGLPPRIFQTDVAGSGGWDPRGLVISSPEAVRNSSGRVDMQLAYGITGSTISRYWGTETVSQQGIYWDSSVARFRIGGMFNTGHFANDMLRLDRMGFQNGTYKYGVVTTRRYYPILCPNGGSTPATTSILDFPDGTEGGFRYVSSAGVTEVFFIAACGTP